MASSSWGSLGSALSLEPDVIEGREGLLQLVTVVTAAASQGKMVVKCKLCDRQFAGVTQRMAAHFAKKTSYHVDQCTKATAESTALGKKYLSALDDKREATRKRAAEKATVRLQQTYLRRKGDGSGKEAADKAFARMLIATGQSFGLGESIYVRNFLDD